MLKKMFEKRKNKAQIKIQEMAFVLLAVVFLFALLFLFFSRFQFTQVQKQAETLRTEKSIAMLRTISAMPELRCSEGYVTTEIACIDKNKLKAFSSPEIRENYEDFWKSAFLTRISIKEVFPEGLEYVVFDSSSQNSITHSTFMPLCEEDKCTIAKVKISFKAVWE